MTSDNVNQQEGNVCKTQDQGCGCHCKIDGRQLWLVLLPIAAVIGATAWFVCS